MNRAPARAVATCVGAACCLCAALSQAGEWSGRVVVDKIVVHADRDVSVYTASEADGRQQDWPNPDACNNSSKVILRPPRDESGVLSGIESYEQAYDALLGAKLSGQKVTVFLNGCTFIGNVTFPLIEAVAIK